jgi:hypothetical protein
LEKSGYQFSTSKSTSTTVDTYDFTQPLDHTAYFDRQFNITFVNNLPGSSGGQIKVNDTTRSSGYVGHTRDQSPTQTISGEALYQVINGIEYTFTSWSPGGGQSASTTFYPTDHATYTANFSAKALAPTALDQTASIGQNVHLSWTDNSNSTRVTQYHIYRACVSISEQKHQVGTVSKGVCGWTDNDIIVKGPKDGPAYMYYVCGVDSATSTEGYEATVSQFAEELRVLLDAKLNDQEGSIGLPTQFEIGSYPNPFNPSTTISYSLPENSSVMIEIVDMTGRSVTSLINETLSAGHHNVVWNGRNSNGKQVASGIYLYRFTATSTSGCKSFTQSGKLVLMK